MSRKISRLVFLAGLVTVLLYWIYVHPPSFERLGYSEDIGNMELTRVLMADSLRQFGHPAFVTSRLMAPTGMSIPFYSWMLERDWIGAYLWMWNPSFPWLWVYFGLSLVLSYSVVGWILRKMNLGPITAWALALFFVLFNVPRHFKLYYHYEHVLQHWVYLSIFFDVWILHRFWREKRWSWNLELWRGFCGIGMLGTIVYHWGPLLLEWFLVHVFLVWEWRRRVKRGERVEVHGSARGAVAPVGLGLALFAVDLRWFLPLAHEVFKAGKLDQGIGFYAPFWMIFRPLWTDVLARFSSVFALTPIAQPETVVTIGWVYLIPVALSVWLVRRKRGGPGVGMIAPFLVFFALIARYVSQSWPFFYQNLLRKTVPFMEYFRTVSRTGLYFSIVAAAIIALAWPELERWVRARWPRPRFRLAAGAFAVMGLMELWTLSAPLVTMPPMNDGMRALLEGIRNSPGTTVLDMPFCMAGGNGVCTTQACPQYPYSTTPLYMTEWHEKKVYGIYSGRLTWDDCKLYGSEPYMSWFSAWREHRCFTDAEWTETCGYLDQHPELSALVVYADLWGAPRDPACQAEFEKHLGPPIAQADIDTWFTRGGGDVGHTQVLRYAARCQKK